jgi:hypothetical protein
MLAVFVDGFDGVYNLFIGKIGCVCSIDSKLDVVQGQDASRNGSDAWPPTPRTDASSALQPPWGFDAHEGHLG